MTRTALHGVEDIWVKKGGVLRSVEDVYRRDKMDFVTRDVYASGPAHNRGYEAFMFGVLAPNGTVVFVPYKSTRIGIYDPFTGVYRDGPAHGKSFQYNSGAFSHGLLAPNGKIILMPHYSNHIGIYDPVEDTYADGPECRAAGRGSCRTGGILLPDGTILIGHGFIYGSSDGSQYTYQAIYDYKSNQIIYINESSAKYANYSVKGAIVNGTVFTGARFDHIYYQGYRRWVFEAKTYDPDTRSYVYKRFNIRFPADYDGPELLTDVLYDLYPVYGHKLCMVPMFSNKEHIHIAVVDVSDFSDCVMGDGKIEFIDPIFPDNRTSLSSYFYGSAMTRDEKIVLAPWYASNVGIIDVAAMTSHVGAACGSANGSFVGAVLTPNNKVVFVPYDSPYVGVYG